MQKNFFLYIFILFSSRSLHTNPLAEQFKQVGYVEICDTKHGITTFNSLYARFDELIQFLQANPAWTRKLYSAKERFIRSKDRSLYSTDFFGFYDESAVKGRGQIAFYYSSRFHDFICTHYPEFNKVPEIIYFFKSCNEIQQSCAHIFNEAAAELGLKTILDNPPILFKVVKYLPSYHVTKPHYDGTALSLFLDSTDNESLLLAPYKSMFTVHDFFSPFRKFPREDNQNSIVLIPGTLLTEFSINPTPHIVTPRGKTRYATIAFAMRPNYILHKKELSHLPNFNH